MKTDSELITILHHSLNEIYIFKQEDLKFVWVNERVLENTQYTLKEICLLTPLELKPVYTKQTFKELLQPLKNNTKDRVTFLTTHLRKDGSSYNVEVHLEKGKFYNEDVFVAIILDTSEKLAQEEKVKSLVSAEKSLSNILYHSQNEIYIFNEDSWKFLWVNLKAVKNLGYALDELLEMTPLDIKPDINHDLFQSTLLPLLKHRKKRISFETIHRRKDGFTYDVEVHIQREEFKQKPAFVAIIIDITNKKKQNALIEGYIAEKTFEANHDAVTALPNRRALSGSILPNLINNSPGRLAFILVDLDNFKDINDTLGSHLGDDLLVEVSKRLSALLNEKDYLIRSGGDEFLIILLDKKKLDNVEQFCERILIEMKKPYVLGGAKRVISVCIGVSKTQDGPQIPLAYANLNAFVQHADYALFHAKKEGRGKICLFGDEHNKQLEKRAYYLSMLNEGDSSSQFEIEFQPILDLQKNIIVGAEVLLRWRLEGQLIYPDEFIPFLEETGKIVAIGDWVINEIITFLSNNRTCLPKDFRVFFNASAIQIADFNFYKTLKGLLAKNKLGSTLLEMEITESIFMKDTLETRENLKNIRDLGVRVAIDDFGTGYSSLEYLRNLPIDTLKIDKSFLDDCLSKKGCGILRSIMLLSVSLELTTVIEGIETEEQLNCIRTLIRKNDIFPVCGQGFLFHKSMSPADFLKLL
jgi:diguanylate cyclase (GGDEF)-like protein/PAS domain S-box-containing protein